MRRTPGLPAAAALLVAALPSIRVPAAAEGSAIIRFADISAGAGIHARISHGGKQKKWIAEANGSGAAVLDYDSDGWMDVLLVSGATMTDLRRIAVGGAADPESRRAHLYRNRDGKRFEDVSARSGLSLPYWGTGANAADYDNDGDVDVLITTIGTDLLYRNEGDGTFVDVSAQAGLSRSPAWHTGSSFGDIDSNGDLDLYVAGYLALEELPLEAPAPVCDYRGLKVFCGPMNLAPGRDILYRNEGDGSFSDVSQRAGIASPPPRPAFTPVIEDFTQDGRPDIFVANDSAANSLFVNRGEGSFAESALVAGLAYNADGKPQADMGACVGDYDSDGDLDLATTTFSEDYFPLFLQQSPGSFDEAASATGLRQETVPYLGWACGFSDLDNDADRDLWVANGHVYPAAGSLGSTSYLQPVRVLENRGGRLAAVPGASPSASPGSFRGGVSADFDNDGRTDLLVLPVDGLPVMLRNVTESGNAWLGISLNLGSGNREAIGARVEIEYCGRRQGDTVRNGGGYASRSDPRLHFGLGDCGEAGAVTVHWPQGKARTHRDVPPNRWVELREGHSAR